MLAEYTFATVSEDVAGLAANISVYRDSFNLLIEQLEDRVSDEILDQLRHANYAFQDVIDALDNVSYDLLDLEDK